MMTKMIPSKFGPIHNTIRIAKAQEDGVGGGESQRGKREGINCTNTVNSHMK